MFVHIKYIRYTQHIIGLVQINIVIVSTWKYTVVVTYEIHQIHLTYIYIYIYMMWLLVHENTQLLFAARFGLVHEDCTCYRC